MSLEGALNLIGKQLYPDWLEKKERKLSTLNKLKLITTALSLKAEYDGRPYKTASELMDFRNAAAHPKPADLLEQFEGDLDDTQPARCKVLMPWERRCTLDFAEQCFEDVGSIIDELSKAANLAYHEMNLDMTFTESTLVD